MNYYDVSVYIKLNKSTVISGVTDVSQHTQICRKEYNIFTGSEFVGPFRITFDCIPDIYFPKWRSQQLKFEKRKFLSFFLHSATMHVSEDNTEVVVSLVIVMDYGLGQTLEHTVVKF